MRKIIFFALFPILMGIPACSFSSENQQNKIIDDQYYTKVSILNISRTLPSPDMLTVDLDTLKLEEGRYSDIYTRIKYVPLETNTDNLIGEIEDIQVYNDNIYILDSKSTKSIFVFTMTGKFIRRIGKVGRGPGEWTNPVSFTIEEASHKIYILDASDQKIYVYSLDGLFTKTIGLDDTEIQSHYIKSKYGKLYLDARIESPNKNKPRYLLREIGFDGVEVNRWLPLSEYNNGWDNAKNTFYFSGSTSISMGSNDLKFVELFMDTIFSISPQGVCPAIVLKSKNLMTREKLGEILDTKTAFGELYVALMKEASIWGVRNYVENDDIIRFKYTARGILINEVLINKKTRTIKHYLSIRNDLVFTNNGGYMTLPELKFGVNKLIIGVLPNLVTFQEILRTYKSNLSDSERNSLLNIPVTNNPILVILQTK